MKQQISIILLVEGQRDLDLLQNYLINRGYNRRKFRFVKRPQASEGSGEKWVRDEFGKELAYTRSYSSRNASSTRWLLVHIDADMLSVDDRIGQLCATPVTAKDSVCIIVPKRNTETWVYHLVNDGAHVSEVDDYKMRVTDDQVREAGRRLADYIQEVSTNCPPSLRRSIAELERIPR